MAKIRHIAYRAEDIEAMAKFFVDAFEMQVVQRRGTGVVDLSDGTINITLLPMSLAVARGQVAHPGIEHIGFTVVDDDEGRRRAVAAGAREMNTVNLGSEVHFEVKFQGPEGIVVDVGHWAGTSPLEADETVGSSAAR